ATPYLHLHFLFTPPAPPVISPLSLHDALPISARLLPDLDGVGALRGAGPRRRAPLAFSAQPVRHPSPERCFSRKPLRLGRRRSRSEEHTSELQSRGHLVCRLLLEKKKQVENIQ